jgi:uncharacterized lipoprotein YddW (UPF0748 family)
MTSSVSTGAVTVPSPIEDEAARFSGEPIYIADLDRCQPAAAISARPARGRWHAVPYGTDRFNGTLLDAGEETYAPAVTYPLDVAGWHAITIGIYQDRYYGDASIQVRLTSDPGYSVITVKETPGDYIYDVFWKAADLTGEQITFEQLHGRVFGMWRADELCTRGRVAYIKLQPLTDAEVATELEDRSQRETKRLFAHHDTGTLGYFMRDVTREEVARELEPYRDTDFARVYWEAGSGDMLSYASQLGRSSTFDNGEHFPFVTERLIAGNERKMRERGFDSFATAIEVTHDAGLEFHAAYRPAGFYFPPPQEYLNAGGFYESHHELRMVDRAGAPQSRIAYSFPETRRFVVSVLREMASHRVDGVAILYNRAPPLVGYEPELVDGFRAATGLDAREIPEDDERWLRYRCIALTTFMRDVRAALDDLARETARPRITLSAVVMGRHDDNLLYGMDAATWAAEGIVDTLIPFSQAHRMNSAATSFPDAGHPDVAAWADLARRTGVTVALNLLPRWVPPSAYRRRALDLYRAGIDNLFFWDAYSRANYYDQLTWNAIRRLGHRDELEAWAKQPRPLLDTTWVRGEDEDDVNAWVAAGEPPLGPTSVELTRLGEWDVATGTPG